jgi:wobble nucleotide-excising tRNase
MIEKIISIKNIGRFTDFQLRPTTHWNGAFKKINLIYAPNGSGKTTLTTIFQSLAIDNPLLITGRRSFPKIPEQIVRIKASESSGLIEFKDKKWNFKLKNIEIFNTHFIEDYLFAGSFLRKNHKTNLFKFLLGQEGSVHKNKCTKVINKTLKYKAKYQTPPKRNSDALQRQMYESFLNAKKEVDDTVAEFKAYAYPIFDRYIHRTNTYLQRFNPNLKLISFDPENNTPGGHFRLFMTFEVHGRKVQFNATDSTDKVSSVKFSMSEGDKNAIAIAFFLAHLESIDISKKIIVFDDPMSSFDSGRKNTTLSILANFCENCQQFIMLTHDIYFAKDFYDRVDYMDVINLKIENDGVSSNISYHDIQLEVLSSLQKDLMTVNNYLSVQSDSEAQRREVIRCIRPILEGILKIKYFNLITPNQWLGDIIMLIRNSRIDSRFNRLKPILTDLIALNDYSKSFHHTGTSNSSENINPFELKAHITLLLNTVDEI